MKMVLTTYVEMIGYFRYQKNTKTGVTETLDTRNCKHLFLPPHPPPFEEKRGDIVFDIPSFCSSIHSSFCPPSRSRYHVFATLIQFIPIPLKLYRCSGHELNMCIMFGYPQIIFCYLFFTKWTHSFFWPKQIDTRYPVYASPPTVLCRFIWNFPSV